jgi:HemY protein
MKRFFIASLVVLMASVAIEYDAGYLLLSYGHYTLETSIWIGLAVFLLLFMLVYGFFSVLRRAMNGTSALSQWFSGRGQRRSQQQTTRGLIAFIEGNWQEARKILSRAASKSEMPLLNYLIAARASHALNDSQQMQDYLQKAQQSTRAASIAVELTQAELQLRSAHYEESLATLTRVRKNAGKHPYVLYLLRQAYIGLKDWQQLLALLPALKKYKVLPSEELQALELQACRESIISAAKVKEADLSQLQKLWQGFSRQATNNSELVACYAEKIMSLGGMHEAEKIIRHQLGRDWHKQLVALYGKVEGEDVGKQLLHAEHWLKERNNDAQLLLCLGRLALRNALWGKARDYFRSSLKLESSAEVCAELGRLLSRLGEHEKSNEYFHQGLMLATDGLPDLPMPNKAV